jgi:hypothetical protein
MEKKKVITVKAAQTDLRILTERAQREPGIAQVLSLLEQVRASEQAIQATAPAADYAASGAFSHTR